MTDRATGAPRARTLAGVGTFDERGRWRERDAPPPYEVRRFVDALDQIPFSGSGDHQRVDASSASNTE